VWSETWYPPERWLGKIESLASRASARVTRGGAYDRWDLRVRCGLFGAVALRMGCEEHGGGRQLVRFRTWPRCTTAGSIALALFSLLTVCAVVAHAVLAVAVLGSMPAIVIGCLVYECGNAATLVHRAIQNAAAKLTAAAAASPEPAPSSRVSSMTWQLPRSMAEPGQSPALPVADAAHAND
jgi:hypothetical protein